MDLTDLFEGAALANGTLANAVSKMIDGYRHGQRLDQTCYAYVGAVLAHMHPETATIQFWGVPQTGRIMHAAAILPDGRVISDTPIERYRRDGAAAIRQMSLADFRALMEKQPA